MFVLRPVPPMEFDFEWAALRLELIKPPALAEVIVY